MNRVDFGRLIASLRQEHEDADMVVWSQERLAEEANQVIGAEVFGKHVISKIERGKRLLDQQTLQTLATALRLTSGEQKEFFLAASGADEAMAARQGSSPQDILTDLTNRMRATWLPAFIMDCYCDVIAANPALFELIDYPYRGPGRGAPQASVPFAYNVARFAFSDEAVEHFGHLMGNSWSKYASTAMMAIRTLTLRYRSTDYFRSLLREMNKHRIFRRYWRDVYYEQKDHFVNGIDMHLNTPKWGPVDCFFAAFTALTSAAELHLWVAAPMSQRTAAVFSRMAEDTGGPSMIVHLASWPDKRLP